MLQRKNTVIICPAFKLFLLLIFYFLRPAKIQFCVQWNPNTAQALKTMVMVSIQGFFNDLQTDVINKTKYYVDIVLVAVRLHI